MRKLWVSVTLLVTSLVFAPLLGADESTKLARLYQVRVEASSEIASFALGSQKPFLAVAHQGLDKGTWTVSVWRAGSGTAVFTETFGHYVQGDPPPVVRFSPQDGWLAIGVQTNILLVDTRRWKALAKLAHAQNLSDLVRVNGLEFSADGKLLLARYIVPAAPDEAQPVVPYDLTSKESLRIHILGGAIDYLGVGETNEPWFAAVERNENKQRWFVLRQLTAHPLEIYRWKLTSDPSPTDEELWRKAHFCQGPELCTRPVGLSVWRGKIHGVFLNPTGETLAAWNARNGEFERLLAKTTGGQIQAAVALRAPLAAAVVRAAASPALVVWDLESGEEICRREFASNETPWQGLVLSANGRYVAVQDGSDSLAVYALKKK